MSEPKNEAGAESTTCACPVCQLARQRVVNGELTRRCAELHEERESFKGGLTAANRTIICQAHRIGELEDELAALKAVAPDRIGQLIAENRTLVARNRELARERDAQAKAADEYAERVAELSRAIDSWRENDRYQARIDSKLRAEL